MDPHFPLPPSGPPIVSFPPLPIVTPDPPPRLSGREKYGGLFYLGVGGLAVLLLLVGWFLWGAWSLRDVWRNVYVLHDRHRSDEERIRAAYALSRDPRVNPRQSWDICLRKPLPELARYLVAESLPAETALADPRGYTLTVARSESWPAWLRLLLTRPLAYAAARGEPLAIAPLRELRDRRDDPATTLWADFAMAATTPPDRDAVDALRDATAVEGPYQPLAAMLVAALDARDDERTRQLDRATRWLRHNHPDARRVWDGWGIDGGRLVHRPLGVPDSTPQPAPKLH
jgi:hypothetical protein